MRSEDLGRQLPDARGVGPEEQKLGGRSDQWSEPFPVNLEGPRDELAAQQQPDALVRCGLAPQRKLLQAVCSAAATNVVNPEPSALANEFLRECGQKRRAPRVVSGATGGPPVLNEVGDMQER
jgi:hypothetical protein